MSEYRVRIPAPAPWININGRLHWSKKAKLTKHWREAALVYAKQEKLPRGLERVHIVAEIHKSNDQKYDAGNLYPTIKACVDGLIDYRLCADDDNAHVTGPDIRVGAKGRAAVTLIITELVP